MKYTLIVMLLLSSPVAAADTLGRLFFSAAQRAQLDQPTTAATMPPTPPSRPDSLRQSQRYTLNGIIQKNGGNPTVWLNQQPQQLQPSQETTARQATIQLPASSHTLKVGESLWYP